MASFAKAGPSSAPDPQVFGHPAGLFTLFFAEMWERFSYYGMRALLVLYMIKGFLAYGDGQAYKVYGAYTALVYATPFIGGLLADKVLGARLAVIFGGTLMALGHLLMGIQQSTFFYLALALLIVGNGFFKPNISTIVGSLYGQGNPRRDAGFTIFYMGINLGAAMAPLLCGYIGEKYGWHYGFNLATFGMLVGLAVFVAPTRVTQIMVLGGALASAAALLLFHSSFYGLLINGFVACALVVAAGVATLALQRGGLPEKAGAAPRPLGSAPILVGLGILLAVPILAWLVQHGTVAGTVLTVFGGGALLYLLASAFFCHPIERDRLLVVLTLMFFSMLFWAFFEQAGSSVSNFTDRNVNRVSSPERVITRAEVGQTLEIEVNQGQLGYQNGPTPFTMTALDEARKNKATRIPWTISEQNVGMTVGGNEMPASTFQAANAVFIVVLGLAFSALWGLLSAHGIEPNTPVKFSLGLIQLGLGFVSLWIGAEHCDARGMVWVGWLLLGYLLHTTGELCLSPVGLSMVTRLSPRRMVSTVMGAWFLATAFSNYLAGLIAGFTGVSHGKGEASTIPVPLESVHVYGGVFKIIAITAIACGVFCLLISPLLAKGMHPGKVVPEAEPEEPDQSAIGFTPGGLE